MSETKELGKIESVKFGIGGYQDATLGLHLTFSGKGWVVGTDKSVWSPSHIKTPSQFAKWTEADREKSFVEIMRFVDKILADAKVNTVDKLKGIPVECTFDGGLGSRLIDWRILTEVL